MYNYCQPTRYNRIQWEFVSLPGATLAIQYVRCRWSPNYSINNLLSYFVHTFQHFSRLLHDAGDMSGVLLELSLMQVFLLVREGRPVYVISTVCYMHTFAYSNTSVKRGYSMQLHWTLLFDILRRSDGNKCFLRYGRNQIWSPLDINISSWPMFVILVSIMRERERETCLFATPRVGLQPYKVRNTKYRINQTGI